MSAVRIQRFKGAAGADFEVHYDPKGRNRRTDDGTPYTQYRTLKVVNLDTEEEYEGDRLEIGCAELGRDEQGRTVAERAYDAAEEFVLTLYEDGHYILAPSLQFPRTGRASVGQVSGYRRTRIGASIIVRRDDQVMAMTDKSKAIRTAVASLQVGHRASFGGTFMHIESGERIVSASAVSPDFL